MSACVPLHGYTVVFRGSRDHYQAAAALSEVGKLDRLITDFYTPDWIMRLAAISNGRMQTFWGRRHSDLIRSRQVNGMLTSALPLGRPWSQPEDVARRMGARAARSTTDGSLIYSYHWLGYLSAAQGRPRGPRVVFQVHPLGLQVRTELTADRDRSGIDAGLEEEEEWTDDQAEAEVAHLRSTHGIITASQFVKHGLAEAGIAPERIQVVPYGFSHPRRRLWPAAPDITCHPGPVKLLWLGQLTYRKGPHWLLAALRSLSPNTAQLTVVTRSQVPAWLGRLPEGTTLVPNASDSEVQRLMAEHDLFVMPSLVEGFGLVYAEALSAGLPILATANSGAPDISIPGKNSIIVRPGSADDIAAQITRLRDQPHLLSELKASARTHPLPTWNAFRVSVRHALWISERRFDRSSAG